MGRYIYNSVMNRWMNNYEQDEYTSSAAFREGYDDPTYMTFKVEFGDWGASVLDRSQIMLGTTVFAAAKNNYDALPIGLLNCPYPGITNGQTYWQNNVNSDSEEFNETTDYSAFRYLRSRNEDTRAKYLYYFVNGLFEIQHDTPYIFKKITGLSALEKFDPKVGRRLTDDTKITIECFEGLSLKIRTLMEFYRKAAWDDVYQKWILPENMRQFKMVIYVFERRVFHDMGTFADEDSPYTIMKYSSLNGDIPVKAYECCPCEFNIQDSMSWNDSYSGNTENTEETSKLVINVKNVKTYYKNGLLNDKLSKTYDGNETQSINEKISDLMIYDLVEGIERSNSDYQSTNEMALTENTFSEFNNMTVNGVRAMFLNKSILLENEDAADSLQFYLWGKSMGGPFSYSQYINDNAINDIKCKVEDILYDRSMAYDYRKKGHVSKATQDSSMDIYSLSNVRYASEAIDNPHMAMTYLYELYPRAGWVNVLVNQPTYDNSQSFWSNLCNAAHEVMHGARRQVLLSGCNAYSLSIDTWNNIINYLYYDGYVSTAIDLPGDIMSLSKGKVTRSTLKQPTILDTSISHGQFEGLEPLRTPTTQTYQELDDPREIPAQVMEEPDDPRTPPAYTYEGMGDPRVPAVLQYGEMADLRDIPEYDMSEMSPLRDVPDQDMQNPGDLREIPEYGMSEMSPLRDVPDQDMQKPGDLREIPEYDMPEMSPLRDMPDQDMQKPGDLRNMPKYGYQKVLDTREMPEMKLESLITELRTLPGFSKITLDNLRDVPEQEIQKLVDTVRKTKPEYKINNMEVIDTISKATESRHEKIISLDKESKDEEKAIFDTLKLQLESFRMQEINDNDEEASKKKKSIANFAKLLSDNSESIKNALAENIIHMKNVIADMSKEAVRDLPKMNMYILEKGESENKEGKQLNDMSMASENDISQLNKNIKIISLSDSEIKELSLTTMINLNKELEDRIVQTQEMMGLSQIIEKSANDDERKKMQNMHRKKGKSRNREMLGLLPPREVNRNQIIY